MRRLLPALALWLASAPLPAAGVHLLVVTGLSGEPTYAEIFRQRAVTLVTAARERLGIPEAQVTWLAAEPEGDPPADGVATRDAVLAAVTAMGEASAATDTIAIVLIGHGTARDGRALFNLPGPDLAPLDLDRVLRPLDGRRQVVVNTAAASAPFVTALSAPGRIVISATGNAAEDRYTRFADPFVEAFAGSVADADKDGVVSLLEAFRHANREVKRLYEAEHRLRTEHALLDDDGDGRGSADAGEPGVDGVLARAVGLAARDGGVPGDDPRALALEAEAREVLAGIAALKRLRVGLSDEAYYARLEELLLSLARNRRALRGEVGS